MTITHTTKSQPFFLIITLLIFGLVGYLGFRTIEHEVLLKRYQAEELANGHTIQGSKLIDNLLQQRATHLNAITDYTKFTNSSIKELIAKDTEIENIFILQPNNLVYPSTQTALTQKEQLFIEHITPIIHDPTLLYAHSIKDEKTTPKSGWYITNKNQEPLLIYWRNQGESIIGFQLSYVKLLSDVINNADFHYEKGSLKIIENDRILYQSTANIADTQLRLLATKYLPYPLTNWQVDYYGEKSNTSTIYLSGLLIVTLLLTAIGLIMYRAYREYTQTARRALQQVNFVSQVSHELKTPLTNITLYAELLKEEQDEHEENLGYTNVIISESQRLARLIQNILTFTQTPKIHLQTFNLSKTVSKIVDTFLPSLAAKEMQIVLDIPEEIMVTSDIDRITQIICNFLSNAEKYAAQGKLIELEVKQYDDRIDIHVRDHGKGISAKEQRLIFQPFYRIKSSITEGIAGTGIGLTIAKQLAQTLQGEIIVTPTTPGVCFTLRLWQTTDLATGGTL